MSDDHVMLKLPKPSQQRLPMKLISLRIGFQPDGNLDGRVILYEKLTGVAFDCAYGQGVVIDPEHDAMAIVCYGQNPQNGDIVWCCTHGPAYAQMADPEGEVGR